MTDDECRALRDRDEIRDVLNRYARAADMPDEALMRSLFHPGAIDEHAGMFSGQMEDIIPKMMEMRKGFNIMQHAISNINIKLDGDVADTECYVVGTMGYLRDGQQYQWLAGGRYVDRFERLNGEWRITKRVSYIDWSRILRVDPTMPTPRSVVKRSDPMNSQPLNAPDLVAQDAQDRHNITQWIEKNIGGRVIRIERQRRWRAVWRVDIEQEGSSRSLLVKGMRPFQSIPYSLEHEMRVMEVLEASGIKVPHVYGMIESPETFVTDWVKGSRDPGLQQEAIENASTISPERWQASLKYMEVLAQMHRIPPERFVGKTEAKIPADAQEVALGQIELFYQMAEENHAVDALTEFFMVWLRRNVPQHRTGFAFVTGDCGQFLTEGEDITAILDMELGYLGDKLHDLACFRGRHPAENMGDVHALLRHYAKVTGEDLDLPVIAYHTVVFLSLAYISPIIGIKEKKPGGAWMEAALQTGFIGRRSLEAMAEIVGVELDEIRLPQPHVTPLEDLAISKLATEIRNLPTSEIFQDWQRGDLASMADYLLNQAHYSRWMEEEDLREIGALLGHRPANLAEADKALRAFVQKAGPELDARLIKLFHRRSLRWCLVLAGPNAAKDHLMLVKLEPTLNLQK
ncbi:MAG: hypothetical protein FP814_16140 [Desulfobacterium sp.]|nr:hypothetical protein [Desulfobacterium sp.]